MKFDMYNKNVQFLFNIYTTINTCCSYYFLNKFQIKNRRNFEYFCGLIKSSFLLESTYFTFHTLTEVEGLDVYLLGIPTR